MYYVYIAQPFARWAMDIKEDPFTPIVDIDRNLPTTATKQFSVSYVCS